MILTVSQDALGRVRFETCHGQRPKMLRALLESRGLASARKWLGLANAVNYRTKPQRRHSGQSLRT